jgi:hypothetical protein
MEQYEEESLTVNAALPAPFTDEFDLLTLPADVQLWVIDTLVTAGAVREQSLVATGRGILEDALFVAQRAAGEGAEWAPRVVALYQRALEHFTEGHEPDR